MKTRQKSINNGARFRALRIELGLRQDEVAKYLGLNIATLVDVERGRIEVADSAIEKLEELRFYPERIERLKGKENEQQTS